MAIRKASLALSVAACAAILIQPHPARAGGSRGSGGSSVNCVFSGGLSNCVRTWHRERDRSSERRTFPRVINVPVPPAADDAEAMASDRHYRKWLQRCRPVIRTDRYGVGYYRYAARGCEFGRALD